MHTVKDLPLVFYAPNEAMFSVLEACVGQLAECSSAGLKEYERYLEFHPRYGNIEEGLAAVKAAVELDYETNLSEQDEVPYSFDYMIDVAIGPSKLGKLRGVAVLTRLISTDPTKGKILYGPTIFRAGPTTFCWWISEDD